jgi:hypothetical protein
VALPHSAATVTLISERKANTLLLLLLLLLLLFQI